LAPDDLEKPLTPRHRERKRVRFRLPVLPLITLGLAAVIVAALGWLAVVDDPLGGEPTALAPIERPVTATAAKVPGETPASGTQTVTIIDGKSGSRTEVAVGSGNGSGTLSASKGGGIAIDPRLAEMTAHGAIPRVGPAGERALDVYSRADPAAAARKGQRIAIVVSGLGVGASATSEAIARLPPAVTLAFTPQGGDLTSWVRMAHGTGHEILLQIPMEPFDYPDNDPGPQTLLTKLSKSQNVDRLHWFLSRAQGYVGVATYMGSRFTANESSFAPILGEIADRGLLYFDDGTSSRSVAPKLASAAKQPFLRADLVIDAHPNGPEIDAALEKLERIADQQGFAIGSAGPLPVSIERIARWAKAAQSRGIRLVPLTALGRPARES
jgi:polysaccharide deacetylase 2 family uncharacterized protein YibQ